MQLTLAVLLHAPAAQSCLSQPHHALPGSVNSQHSAPPPPTHTHTCFPLQQQPAAPS